MRLKVRTNQTLIICLPSGEGPIAQAYFFDSSSCLTVQLKLFGNLETVFAYFVHLHSLRATQPSL